MHDKSCSFTLKNVEKSNLNSNPSKDIVFNSKCLLTNAVIPLLNMATAKKKKKGNHVIGLGVVAEPMSVDVKA